LARRNGRNGKHGSEESSNGNESGARPQKE
jgi:hypothetical protein